MKAQPLVEMPFMEVNAMSSSSPIRSDEPVNTQELIVLRTLLTKIARDQDVELESLQTRIATRFGVKDLTKMRRTDILKALEFLTDMHFDEIRSKK